MDSIFISYAREDHSIAEKLYNDLKKFGLILWMDIKNISIGQNWKFEVQKAIKESKYFLALLSSNSISKRGYVQKELKIALEILDEVPQSEIFLLPILIDECKPIDEKLKDIHWGKLFPSYDSGLSEILKVVCDDKRFLFEEKNQELSFSVLINDPDREINLMIADITSLKTDAIVNPTSPSFGMKGQIGKKILEKGGDFLRNEILDLKKSNFLNTHSIAISDGGRLSTKKIFHVESYSNEHDIYKLVYQILNKACEKQLKSIAIPALGTGSIGISNKISAKAIIKAIKDFASVSEKWLEIIIVLYDEVAFNEFKNAFYT